MWWSLILKGAGILLILFLALCVYRLNKIAMSYPKGSEEAGWVTFGTLAEIILIIEVALKVIM